MANKMAASNPQIQQSEDSETPPAKKRKLANENSEDDSNLQTFRGFKLIKVLNENAQTKNIVVHGKSVAYLSLIGLST